MKSHAEKLEKPKFPQSEFCNKAYEYSADAGHQSFQAEKLMARMRDLGYETQPFSTPTLAPGESIEWAGFTFTAPTEVNTEHSKLRTLIYYAYTEEHRLYKTYELLALGQDVHLSVHILEGRLSNAYADLTKEAHSLNLPDTDPLVEHLEKFMVTEKKHETEPSKEEITQLAGELLGKFKHHLAEPLAKAAKDCGLGQQNVPALKS